jgi:hypothetical protein
VEPIPPVIDRPAAEVEQLGDPLGRFAVVEPEQRLGRAPLLGQGVWETKASHSRRWRGERMSGAIEPPRAQARVLDGSW